VLREPKVWIPFLGAALVVGDVGVPQAIIDSLYLIGGATTGLSLFIVGLIISEEKIRLNVSVALDVVLKNLVHPAAMLTTVVAFGVTGVLAREAILLAAIPSAVITSMFAEDYRTLASESSTAVLATRVAAFATIPIVIALTRHM